MAKKNAEKNDPVKKPNDWDKAVSVAYLRIIGYSQQDAAASAGAGSRTVRAWEKSSWWHLATSEAKGRWLQGLAGKARKCLERGVGEDPNLALKVLERMDEDLVPARKRLELSGKVDSGVLRVDGGMDPDAWERLASDAQAKLAERASGASAVFAGSRQSGNGKNNGNGRKP